MKKVLLNVLFIFFSHANLPNSLCLFWKRKVSSPSNFASIFNVIKHSSSVLFFSRHIIYFGQGSQLKGNFLDLQVIVSKFVKFLMSILKWQVNPSSNFALFFIVTTHNYSVNFKLLHFRLLSARVKIRQIIHASFKTISQFLFNCFVILHCHDI